jgi:hypothetical protein
VAVRNPAEASLYIGNLCWWTTDAQIEAAAAAFGPVRLLRFFEDKSNGKSKGYALLEFEDVDTVRPAKVRAREREREREDLGGLTRWMKRLQTTPAVRPADAMVC